MFIAVYSRPSLLVAVFQGHLCSLQYFKALFDPVIDEKHLGFGPCEKHPAPELEPAHVSRMVVIQVK